MASTGEQPHFSSRTLDLGEKAQRVFGRTAVGRWATGSNVPAYTRLDWFRIDADPNDIPWARTVPGDPKAGRLPRSWHNAAILGVAESALARLGAHEGATAGGWAKDAVAFESEGTVRVGINPEGDHLFGGSGRDDEILSVAMRLGTGPLRAAMGHYQPESGRLMVPEGIVVLEECIPNADIKAPEYPHTRLAG